MSGPSKPESEGPSPAASEYHEARRVEPSHNDTAGKPSQGERAWVAELASWLDTRYRIPGTAWRFGLDAVIGLLPVAGDAITALIGGAMVVEALRLRLGTGVVVKMLGNLGIDFVVGLVPGADLVLDVAFKAHARNAKLICEELAMRQQLEDAESE